MAIRVVVADDHLIFRSGLCHELATHGCIEVVGEATSRDEALRLCEELKPDVLLLDVHMPGSSALQLVTCLQRNCPNLKVLAISAYHDQAVVQQLIAAGVAGYALKDEPVESLLTAVETVARGAIWLSQPIMSMLFAIRDQTPQPSAESALSERERQVLCLIAQGWNNAQIAAESHLREQTVRNYASHIYAKIGVAHRGQAIVRAREHGLSGSGGAAM
ncbi:MAG: response regulator [Anaerolineae bacterium]